MRSGEPYWVNNDSHARPTRGSSADSSPGDFPRIRVLYSPRIGLRSSQKPAVLCSRPAVPGECLSHPQHKPAGFQPHSKPVLYIHKAVEVRRRRRSRRCDQPAICKVTFQRLEPFGRLAAGNVTALVYLYICGDKGAHQPRPNCTLMVSAIAFGGSAGVSTTVLRIAGRQAAQAERSEQMP